MAETAVSAVASPSRWSTSGTALTMTAVDNANGNKFASTIDQILIVQNTSGGALTFQMTSQALPPSNRTGHVSQSLAAGEIRVFRLSPDGWKDTNGFVLIPTGLNAALKVAIVDL